MRLKLRQMESGQQVLRNVSNLTKLALLSTFKSRNIGFDSDKFLIQNGIKTFFFKANN